MVFPCFLPLDRWDALENAWVAVYLFHEGGSLTVFFPVDPKQTGRVIRLAWFLGPPGSAGLVPDLPATALEERCLHGVIESTQERSLHAPGQYQELERRLRANPQCSEIPTLVAYAFDYRTRMGPFVFTDKLTLTAGPRAISAALYNAGFTRQRLVHASGTLISSRARPVSTVSRRRCCSSPACKSTAPVLTN